jgi:hypothetical protein
LPESKHRKKEKSSRRSSSRNSSAQGGGESVVRTRHKPKRQWGRILAYVAASIVAVAVIGSFILSGVVGSIGGSNTTGTGEEVGERVTLLPAQHIPRGDDYTDYNSVPPTSGPHWATGWARCGLYNDELPDAQVVHNMEHGQVIISHNLKDPAEIERLKDVARSLPSYRNWLILRPYSKIQDNEVAIASWGWMDRFTGIDEQRIRDFYEAHMNAASPVTGESIPCTTGG